MHNIWLHKIKILKKTFKSGQKSMKGWAKTIGGVG